MRVGIGSWAYAWAIGVPGYPAPAKPLTPLDLLAKARELDVRLVQFADNLPLDRLSAADLEALRKRAMDWDITLELGTRGVQPAHLLRYLEIAKFLNAELLRTLTHTPESTPDLPRVRDWILEVLPALASAGVCLALENYEKHTSMDLAGLIRDIGSPHVGICLDTVNSLGALETPEQVVGELGPYALNVHVKDFEIRRVPSMMGYVVAGRPAGEGRLNLDWLISQLLAYGKQPSLILELWTPFTGGVEETIALEQEWAARSIHFLRRFET